MILKADIDVNPNVVLNATKIIFKNLDPVTAYEAGLILFFWDVISVYKRKQQPTGIKYRLWEDAIHGHLHRKIPDMIVEDDFTIKFPDDEVYRGCFMMSELMDLDEVIDFERKNHDTIRKLSKCVAHIIDKPAVYLNSNGNEQEYFDYDMFEKYSRELYENFELMRELLK